MNDIKIKKEAIHTFNDSNEIPHLMPDSIPLIISYVDKDGKLQYCNSRYEQFFGLSFEDIKGLPLRKVLDGQTYKSVKKQLELALSGHNVSHKTEIRLRNGELRQSHWDFVPHRNGGSDVCGCYLYVIDISEHKKAEQALWESDHRFRMLLEQVPNIAIQGYRPDGTIHYWNRANESIYGYTENEAMGNNLVELIIPPDMRDFVRDAIANGAQTGEMPPPGELRLMRKDGSLIDVFSSHAIVKRPGHEPLMFCLDVDITKRKKTEIELKKQQTQLKHNQKDLQKLAGRLILNQEEELKWLARELHDDLSQRLAVMSIEAGNCCQHFKDSPEQALQGIINIKEHLVKMAKDVHNLSRELHPSIIDDLGLIRAVELECDSFSSRMGITVMFTPKNICDKLPVNISLCIYRIIQACLSNIAKHANTKNAYVFLECSNNNILLTVRDTGKGFDYARVRKKPGLGLASLRERVRLVNGSLSITSQPGEGTEVEVVVPLKNRKTIE